MLMESTPAGHVEHVEAPTPLLYVPLAQAMHPCEPVASLNEPGAHGMQPEPFFDVAPSEPRGWPYQPGVQAQWVAPAEALELGGHASQAEALTALACMRTNVGALSQARQRGKARHPRHSRR